MLVLIRSADESVMIGDDLEIQVVEVTACAVRLRAERRTVGGRLTKEIFDGFRLVGATITLGEGVKCLIGGIRNERVRIGIIAPMDVSIHRREVWEAVRRECENDLFDLDS